MHCFLFVSQNCVDIFTSEIFTVCVSVNSIFNYSIATPSLRVKPVEYSNYSIAVAVTADVYSWILDLYVEMFFKNGKYSFLE